MLAPRAFLHCERSVIVRLLCQPSKSLVLVPLLLEPVSLFDSMCFDIRLVLN